MRASFFLRNVIPVVFAGLALMAFSSTALAHDAEGLDISVQCTSLDRTVLGISINKFEQETITVSGRDYLAVNLEGEGRVMKEGSGYPHLPALYRSIMIPDAAKMEVNVLDQAFTDYTDVDLISSKGDLLRMFRFALIRAPLSAPVVLSSVPPSRPETRSLAHNSPAQPGADVSNLRYRSCLTRPVWLTLITRAK